MSGKGTLPKQLVATVSLSDTESFGSKEMEVACVSVTDAGDCKSSADTQHAETTTPSQFSVSLLMETKRVARTDRVADQCTTIDGEDSKSSTEWCATAPTVADTTDTLCFDAIVQRNSERANAVMQRFSFFETHQASETSKKSRVSAILSDTKLMLSMWKLQLREQWDYLWYGMRRFDASLGFGVDYIDFATSKYRSLLADDCIPEASLQVAVLRGKLPFRFGLETFAIYAKELTALFGLCFYAPIRCLFAESRFGIRRGPQQIQFQAATDKPVLLLDIDHCILDNDEKKYDPKEDGYYSDEHKPLEIDRVLDADGVCDDFDIRLRPGLIEFLREVRRRYRVVLFTAAGDLYDDIFTVLRKYFREHGADFDLIFTRKQSLTFWRREGDSGIEKPHIRKDPTRLGFSPQFGVVLDDSFQVWAGEWAANTLLIPPYKGNGPADDCLKQAAEILRRVATHPLSAEGDIRYALHGINAEDIDDAEKHLGRALSRKRATDRSGALQATRDVCLMLALKSGLDSVYLRVFEELLMDGTATDPVICSYAAEYSL